MTDFDNGLPPEGTTTEAKIDAVLFEHAAIKDEDVQQIKSVIISKTEAASAVKEEIKSVLINTEEAGANYGMFI
ncbi:MAG: hypothetical protein LBN74_09435 [Prevotella sp.]|jgi:hypothetical protein|nr:hypothetical protein [Prevotella sp.]